MSEEEPVVEVNISEMMVMIEKRLIAEKEAGNTKAQFIFEDDDLIRGALDEVKEIYTSKGWTLEYETTPDGILVTIKEF